MGNEDTLSLCWYAPDDRVTTFTVASGARTQLHAPELCILQWAEERGHGETIKGLCADGCDVKEEYEAGVLVPSPNSTDDPSRGEFFIHVQIDRTKSGRV